MCFRVELDPTSKLGKFFEETKEDCLYMRSKKLEEHKAFMEIHNKVAEEGQSRDSLQYALEFCGANLGQVLGKGTVALQV